MKYIKQFGIILAAAFIGEALHYMLPLPVPASIYGLVIMLLLLCSGRLKVQSVKAASDFLIGIMPMMFIPAAVGLINSWDMIRPRLLPYAAVTLLSLWAVMIISGRTAQFVIKREDKKK